MHCSRLDQQRLAGEAAQPSSGLGPWQGPGKNRLGPGKK